jgi:hypothetical protein
MNVGMRPVVSDYSGRLRTALPVLTVALAGIMAAPATAAPQLEPLNSCYVAASRTSTEPVFVGATGFPPRTRVRVRVASRTRRVRTNAIGALRAVELPAPYVARGEKRFVVAVNGLRERPLVSALSVTTSPARGNRPVTWRGRGFTAEGDVYAHVLIDEREPEDFRLATPKNACGTFIVRHRLLPAGVRARRWTVQIDQYRTYRPRPAGPHVRLWFAYDDATAAAPAAAAQLTPRPALPASASR